MKEHSTRIQNIFCMKSWMKKPSVHHRRTDQIWISRNAHPMDSERPLNALSLC